MKIIFSKKFEREYKKLPVFVKKSAEKKELIFRSNLFDASLNVHKLHGKLKNYWSFSIGYNYRIIFEFENENLVYFYSVGTHEIYQ